MTLPPGLDVESLPGPKRGVTPAVYVRDEIVYAPSGRYFALCYSIFETSMGNEVGCVLWGEIADGTTRVLGNPEGVYATCWFSPWAEWLDDETFVFKAQRYDGSRLHLPLVAIRIGQGFSVVPGSKKVDSRPSDLTSPPDSYEPTSATALLAAIVG